MCPTTPWGMDEVDADEVSPERGQPPHAQRFRRRRTTDRPKMRARRSRSNEMAKRGIHQRRNKRSAW